MKEILEQYVKQVKEWHEHCRGNEQATKASLIAPLFTSLGYAMHDPRECKPEYRTDFGKGEKAATPVDWAFLVNGSLTFFVEAKEVGAKLTKYAEQLGMYFAKEPAVKLGILTNGTQWRFFTDLVHDHVMDTEPFFTWDVLKDDPLLPLDLLTILQKSQFKSQLIETFARRKHHQNLLVAELNRLLEPSPEFIRLAVQNIETRPLIEKRIEEWKPILANAIQEWAKQRALTMALQQPSFTPAPESASPRKKAGKICPSCQTVVGPRTKLCPCGHIFISKLIGDDEEESASMASTEKPFEASSGKSLEARESVQPTNAPPTN